MKLKDSQTLFGVPIAYLREHSKKYRVRTWLLYLFDIFLVFGATAYMFYNNVRYEVYGLVLVMVCILVNFVAFLKLGEDKWETFKFYKKHMNCDVTRRNYDVTEANLYSILYCTGYKRLKQNLSLQEYKELMLSACCENIRYSSSLMKNLAKYEAENGNLSCYAIVRGSRQFFIDFVPENKEEASLDEHDYAGAVERTDSWADGERSSSGEGVQHPEDTER